MKTIRKANGDITHVNEKFLDQVLEEGDQILEDSAPPELVINDEIISSMERSVLRRDAKKYLAETDWYVSRKAETGKAIPDDILTKRAQARLDASE